MFQQLFVVRNTVWTCNIRAEKQCLSVNARRAHGPDLCKCISPQTSLQATIWGSQDSRVLSLNPRLLDSRVIIRLQTVNSSTPTQHHELRGEEAKGHSLNLRHHFQCLSLSQCVERRPVCRDGSRTGRSRVWKSEFTTIRHTDSIWSEIWNPAYSFWGFLQYTKLSAARLRRESRLKGTY